MDLFENEITPEINLLPYGGTAHYFGQILLPAQTEQYFNILLNTITWKNDEVRIFGRHIITKRKTAWYGDSAFSYTYSNNTKEALPWTPELLELKTLIQQKTGHTFNSCLLNLYHTGDEGMAWHSDDEKMLLPYGPIASLTLGAERKFAFKHKQTKETITLNLAPGSLLLMKNDTQTNWLHRLPPTKKVNKPRINLTFRTIML